MPEKIFKSEWDAPAGVSIGSECARMHGNDHNYVQIDSVGTFVSGGVSFLSTMPQIRTGAMWTFNNNFAMSIPSTLGTPSPTLVVNPPIKQIQSIAKQATTIGALFGMFRNI